MWRATASQVKAQTEQKAHLPEQEGPQQTASRLHLQHRLFRDLQQTAFGLKLQLFLESPARQLPPADFGLVT